MSNLIIKNNYNKLKPILLIIIFIFPSILQIIFIAEINLRKVNEPSEEVLKLIGYRGLFKSGKVTVILNCSVPHLPTEVPLLKIIKNVYNKEIAIKIAREVFNITGKVRVGLYRNRKGFVITNGTQRLRLDFFNSGTIKYLAPYKISVSYGPNPLPSYDEVKRKADEILWKLFCYGIIPDNLIIKFRGIYPHRECGLLKRNITWIADISASYSIWYENYYIYGSRISIAFNRRGLTEFYMYLWHFKKVGSIKLNVSVYDALRQLGIKAIYRTGVNPIKIIVNGVFLAFDTGLLGEEYKYALPIYIFKCIVVFPESPLVPPGERISKDWIVIPAIKFES